MTIGICKKCSKNSFVATHHKFPQTKLNKRLYPEFINHKDNLVYSICHNCHSKEKNWTEIEFCNHFNIVPRSKTGLEIYKRKTC